MRLGTAAAQELTGYDEVVPYYRRGTPRIPAIPRHRPTAVNLRRSHHQCQTGRAVAVVGAGGIGFDVTELLVTDSTTLNLKEWKAEQVVDPREARGALTTPPLGAVAAQVYPTAAHQRGPQGKGSARPPDGSTASSKAKGVYRCLG